MDKVIIVLLVLNSISWASEFDLKPLSKWLESQKDIKTVQANFIQKRKLATLENEIVTAGKLWVEYPEKFHWQMGDPAKALILRNGKNMQFYNLRKNTVDSFSIKSEQGKRYAFMTSQFASSLQEFQKSFNIKKVWQEGDVYYCLFQSKSSSLRKKVPFLAVGIYHKKNVLGLFEMHLEDKSIIRTTFTDYKTNLKINSEKFVLE